jgi:hypothetical protein
MVRHDDGCVLEPVRSILRIEAGLLLASLIAFYGWLHASWLVFIVLLLAPDIAMAGYFRNTRVGAWCYNAAHTYVAPLALGIGAFFEHALLPFAIVWAAHIAMDRALGYGLKYGDSFGHTHLGFIGRSAPRE